MPQNEVTTTNRDWEIAIVRANALHGQITGLTNQIQTLEQKRWMTAVVLGGLLARMKAAAQHGEWKALFGKSDTCVTFEYRTAARYMKLYREVLKRARKLGTVDVALIESGRRDARTLERSASFPTLTASGKPTLTLAWSLRPNLTAPAPLMTTGEQANPSPLRTRRKHWPPGKNQHVMNLPASWWTLKPCWIPDACRW